MSGRSRFRRGGFTLVELLVVIAIIGVLVGLAIPVIQMAQARARTMECANKMRNVSHAVLYYESANRQYPGYSNVLIQSNGQPYTDPITGQKHAVSYVPLLWAWLERPDLDRMWRTAPGAVAAGGQGAAPVIDPRIEVQGLWCPADPPTLGGGAPLSYVVNAGMKDVAGTPGAANNLGTPRDWPENGVFFDLYTDSPRVAANGQGGGGQGGGGQGGAAKARVPLPKMSSATISRGDGVANTLMISENVDAGEYLDYTEAQTGMLWDGTGSVDLSRDPPTLKPRDDNMRINVGIGLSDLHADGPNSRNGRSQDTTFARPSSWHPKGVNVAFCDGRVSFINESTEYYVYCLLMSTYGSRVRQPGSNKILPNFDRPLVESWYMP